MTHDEQQLARYRAGAATLTAAEKRAVADALRTATRDNGRRSELIDAIVEIVAARGRDAQKRASDTVTDARRRVLVGARVPRELAAGCKARADGQGVSLYKWVVDIIQKACENEEM